MANLFPAIGDVLQCRIICNTPSQAAINVLHYNVTDIQNGPFYLDDLAELYGGIVEDPIRNFMPSTARFYGIGFKILSGAPSIEVVNGDHGGAGTAGGGLLPTQVSGIVKFLSNTAGKANRGRMYPGFPANSGVDANGETNATYYTRINNIAAVLGGNMGFVKGAATITLQQFVKNKNVLTGQPVDRWVGETLLATQRRRGDFGQKNLLPQ